MERKGKRKKKDQKKIFVVFESCSLSRLEFSLVEKRLKSLKLNAPEKYFERIVKFTSSRVCLLFKYSMINLRTTSTELV